MNDVDRLALHYLAANTFSIVAQKFGGGCSSGYLFCRYPDGLMMRIPLGGPVGDKHEKHRQLSREMADRLGQHPRNWLSSETRQPERERFGGAARGKEGVILSFSGLPENIDEAFVLALLVGMDWCTFDQALERLGRSPIAHTVAFIEIQDIVMMTASGGRLTV